MTRLFEGGVGLQWLTGLGSDAPGDQDVQVAFGAAVLPDRSGLVVGTFEGTLTHNGSMAKPTSMGGGDVFIATLSRDGGVVTTLETFGGSGKEVATDVAASGDVSVIVGSYASAFDFQGFSVPLPVGTGIFVLRMTAGSVDWLNTYDGPFDENALDVALDSDGHIVVVGTLNGTVTFDGIQVEAGPSDGYVLGLDSAGMAQFAQPFDASVSARPAAVAVDRLNGQIVVGVTFEGTLSMLGDIVQSVDNSTDIALFAFTPLWDPT